jgi:hypothetical protein
MNAELDQKREELNRLCQQFGVRRLAIFGSGLREDFDSQRSDFDFLVEFQPLPSGTCADTYFGLMEGLQNLFQRPVDLIVESAIRNPYFRESVQRNNRSLYAA